MTRRFVRCLQPVASTLACLAMLSSPKARASEKGSPPGDPLPTQPGDFAVKVEPGVAIPITSPQSQLFKVGASETLKALWSINRYLDVGPSGTFVVLPGEAPQAEAGTAWTLGGSLRLKRPHDSPDADTFYAASPWVDVDALYVRTGELNRPGFAAAAGLSVPVGESRTFWVGPFVRYFQIIQPNSAGFDDRDAKIVSIGLSLEVGSGVERPREVVTAAPAPVLPAVHTETNICPDRDRDGVPDSVDRCPDVAGSADNYGCPEYKKIIVKRDKLELKEKLYFAWNQTAIQEASFPVLDEVVQALHDNSSFHVAVEGNTSSEGTDDHNQTLSEGRAQAVLDYLVAHGIAKERLTSKGFASSRPIDTNSTAAGRENNRRVEFVVHFNILNDGSK